MGRTMAGKSTLFEYLSTGDGARIGDGRQRFSRDSCVRVATGAAIEIVDTPGVGAMDGSLDYDAAFDQVADADLIVWVATDQATQNETGRALEQLADLGKPILVALNCLHDVTDEIGLLDMLEEPDRVFGGDAQGNLAPIRRHLAHAGGQYIEAVAVHAQAAQLSRSGEIDKNDSQTLHRNSRIDVLVNKLRDQAARTAEQRRIVSICDAIGVELMDVATVLETSMVEARSVLAVSASIQDAFGRRAFRRVDDAYEELTAAFASALAARERWVDHADVDQSLAKINQQWSREVEVFRTELEQSVADVARRLDADLQTIALDVADDWAEFDVGAFVKIGSRGTIWGNRAVKTGGRFAASLGALALGAKIGAVAGTAIGPGIGTAIGAIGGGIIGLLAGLLGANKFIDWAADKTFRNSAEVHDRRRTKVREQMSQLLEKLAEEVWAARGNLRRKWVDAIENDLARQSGARATIARSIEALQRISSDGVEPVIVRIDTELARELLRSMGRTRAASAVTRATRWRGAGIAVEVAEPAFSELVLFPPDENVQRILPTSIRAPASASALQIVRYLTNLPVTVHQMDPDRLDVALDAPLAAGVREAWEALARVHTGVNVGIHESIEGAAS
jgi:hypothetical protein